MIKIYINFGKKKDFLLLHRNYEVFFSITLRIKFNSNIIAHNKFVKKRSNINELLYTYILNNPKIKQLYSHSFNFSLFFFSKMF